MIGTIEQLTGVCQQLTAHGAKRRLKAWRWLQRPQKIISLMISELALQENCKDTRKTHIMYLGITRAIAYVKT